MESFTFKGIKAFLKLKSSNKDLYISMVSKAASPRKISGVMSGCLYLKSFKVGSKAFESARDLSSSGDFDFFSTVISG